MKPINGIEKNIRGSLIFTPKSIDEWLKDSLGLVESPIESILPSQSKLNKQEK